MRPTGRCKSRETKAVDGSGGAGCVRQLFLGQRRGRLGDFAQPFGVVALERCEVLDDLAGAVEGVVPCADLFVDDVVARARLPRRPPTRARVPARPQRNA